MIDFETIIDNAPVKPAGKGRFVLAEAGQARILAGLKSDDGEGLQVFALNTIKTFPDNKVREWICVDGKKHYLGKSCDYLAMQRHPGSCQPFLIELTGTGSNSNAYVKMEQLYRTGPLLEYICSLGRLTHGQKIEMAAPVHVLLKGIDRHGSNAHENSYSLFTSRKRIRLVRYATPVTSISVVVVESNSNATIGLDEILGALRIPLIESHVHDATYRPCNPADGHG